MTTDRKPQSIVGRRVLREDPLNRECRIAYQVTATFKGNSERVEITPISGEGYMVVRIAELIFAEDERG